VNGQDSQETSSGPTEELCNLNAIRHSPGSIVQEEGKQRACQLVGSVLTCMGSIWDGCVVLAAIRADDGDCGWDFYGPNGKLLLEDHVVEALQTILTADNFTSEKGFTSVYDPNIPEALRQRELQAVHLFPVRTYEKNFGILLLGSYEAMRRSP